MDLIEYVLEKVNKVEYYQKRIPEWDGDAGTNVLCPFHEETTASFSVNIQGEGGCFCHGCDKKIGSIIHFEKELLRDVEAGTVLNDEEAARSIYHEFMRPVFESDRKKIDKMLHEMSDDLLTNNLILKTLHKDLGVDDSSIGQFNLGYYEPKNRITIPIFDQFDHLVNIRYYQLPSTRRKKGAEVGAGSNGQYPKIYSEKGYGGATLFPIPQVLSVCRSRFKPEILYWMAGERDTILAWYLGCPAITLTGGESTELSPTDEEFLKNLHIPIAIVGDNDTEGRKCAEKRLETFFSIGLPVVRILLPPEYKDFSEWIIKGKGTSEKLRELTPTENIHTTTEGEGAAHSVKGKAGGERTFLKIVDPQTIHHEGEFSVSDIGRKPHLLNGIIQVKGVISGKMDRTYSIPNLFEHAGNRYRMPICRELLQMIRMSDDNIEGLVRKLLGTKANIVPLEWITVTEVEVIPMIVPGVDSFYVNQRCYFFGEKIESNLPYLMKVIPTSAMESQETVGMIIETTPVTNTLDDFNFDIEQRKLLANKFSVSSLNKEAVLQGMEDLAQELADRHTLIYNRNDLHILSLLTWTSPIQFDFFREGRQRGWMNSLALGDTQTGKSHVSQALRELFNCGVFINAENCTYVGLVGGTIKTAAGFMLRWGKIPLYNRQLVVIEEMSGISTDQISHMSDIRSSGIARLDKGGLSGETAARTRLLFLSNVRDKYGAIATAASGVIALQELIGHNEDISRFDMILTLIDSEVSNEIINRDRLSEENIPQPYSKEEIELFKKLIIFIWSLKPEQIEITRAAYVTCLQQTLLMSKDYHPNVPIFKAGSGRLKLARVACAIAALQFAWNETTQKLTIEPPHVEAAAQLLRQFYDKPSLGYGKFSKQMFFMESLYQEEKLMKALNTVLPTVERQELFFRYFSQIVQFNSRDLVDALAIPPLFAERLVSAMFSANAIGKPKKDREKSSGSSSLNWEITLPGRKWIERAVFVGQQL